MKHILEYLSDLFAKNKPTHIPNNVQEPIPTPPYGEPPKLIKINGFEEIEDGYNLRLSVFS